MAKKLFFDPDRHAEETLKWFNEFIEMFKLRYKAHYPDPPKLSIYVAIERWKLTNEDAKPTLEQYDAIKAEWQSKDKIAKFLGMYASKRFYDDFKVPVPTEEGRDSCDWPSFVKAMNEYYKPTANCTLQNFHFRALQQASDESFTAFCNRVGQEAKHCEFKCESSTCSAEEIAIRDQTIIGLKDDFIREEALKHSWKLSDLRTNGMRLESAARGVS